MSPPRIDKAWLDAKTDEMGMLSANPETSTEARLERWGVDGDELGEWGTVWMTEQLGRLEAMLLPEGHVKALERFGGDYRAIIAGTAVFGAGFELGYLAALERDDG